MTELPSGTVTFLFTDIEGSTRLLKQLRERYGNVLAEHERILRTAFTEAGGQEIDTQGDAFFVAFRRARDAVAATIAAQRALAEHAWPDGGAVRVRMGIHTGEPAVGSDRYVGLGVHRAARICSAAHGGQVLLSNTTRDLVEDELPPDVRARDLGEHNLKDLDRPERLFQLEIDGLLNDFPPPRTEAGDTDALVSGRERELADAARAAVSRFRAVRRRPVVSAVAAVAAIGGVIAVVALTRGGSSAAATGIAANAVGLIDARNDKVRREVEVDKSPVGVAVGEGAVWVTNANDGTVSRIDADTGGVVQTITVGTNPNGIAVAGGSIWVANHDDGTVSRISPATNSVVQSIPVGSGPTAVAGGAGSIWVTNATDRTVTRIDPDTGHEITTIRTNAVGRGVAVGAGSVWVSDESTGSVVRIDASTNDVAAPVSVGNGPSGVAFGAGAVWVANSLDGTVSRIDPTSGSVTATVQVGGGPGGIAVGKDAVWVSAEFGERIVKLDPVGATPRIIASLPVENRPKGVAVGKGGCWVAVQTSGSGHHGGRLVVLNATFLIESLDPAAQFELTAVGLVYDGLTSPRRTGGADGTQIVPNLAATLPAPANSGRTYTFRLRRGIQYSDGRPVRPEDFRRALERGLRVTPDEFGVWGVVGATTACAKGRCDLSRGVIVRGDTITFRLVAPSPAFLLRLSTLAPIPPRTPARESLSKPPVGTGPYMVETFVPGRHLRLVRNPKFHVWAPAARPAGYPDEIVFSATKPEKVVAAVAAGRADLGSPPPERVAELKARYGRQLHVVPQNATVFLFLNTRQPPFDDIRVRRALNFAVDRAKLVAFHGADLAQPTCQTVPPTVPGYVRYCPYTVDPNAGGEWRAPDLAKARQLIAASHTVGTKVVVWSFGSAGREARYIVSLLRRLGYRAQVHVVTELGPYFAQIGKRHPQAGIAGWFGIHLPDDMFAGLSCDVSTNWADFCDRRFDGERQRLAREEVENLSTAADQAARVDRMIVDRSPWVPLFTPRRADFVSKRVGNYQYNATQSVVLLDQLWVR